MTGSAVDSQLRRGRRRVFQVVDRRPQGNGIQPREQCGRGVSAVRGQRCGGGRRGRPEEGGARKSPP
ncbi:hypothetical protein [Streptomyces sp. D2-8]|uniref:hypothetical protein n=1 Tax=Streptomyces sp. D2-8 TaxID=2707767 RepID=UPI0020BD984A|nr:hypothetical protein [Streptomyces sp. D2-8]